METHEAYPLDWPVGQARTPADRRGPTGHYLEKARLCHPDRGGSHDDMVELNAALAEAEAELGAKV